MAIPFFVYHCSLRISAIFDHFGYPPPHLDQWQQCIWYDLGAAQELLHQMRTRLARGLPTVASPQRAESPLLLHKPASMPTCPSQGGKFVKASKGGGPSPGTATAGPSLSTVTTSPKTETKRKKKRKITKRTITRETISRSVKKVKLISESPDSEVEGPFRDSDHTGSVSENSSHPSSGILFINSPALLQKIAFDAYRHQY